MFKKRLFPGMLGVILGITIISWAPFGYADGSIVHNKLKVDHLLNRCEQHLKNRLDNITTRMRVKNLYKRYEVQELGTDEGYYFRYKGVQFDGPVIDIPIEEQRALWRMHDWKTERKRYQFLDTGLRGLAPESSVINLAFMDYAERNPGVHLRIQFSPQHIKERESLYMMHWRVHDAVLKKYDKAKEYLTGWDYMQLSWASVYSDHNDLFALLSGDPKPADKLSWSEVYDRLALTMQVVYYGKRDYFKPSDRGGIVALGMQDFDQNDMLPFEFRLPPDEKERIAAEVYSRFDKKTTCELIRYVRFADDLPREAHDRFLLQVLERLEGRGMRTMLASTDEITSKYFGGRYGFEKLMTLPTKQKEMKEYLMFMEVGSPQYENLKTYLKTSGKGVVEGR